MKCKPPSEGGRGLGYNLRLVRFSTMIRLFFILYCFEAGLLLLFAPWFPEWERIMMQVLPFQGLRSLVLQTWFRGAVTGFGLVHLIWGAHDLISVIFRRRPEAAARDRQVSDIQAPDVQAHDVPAAGDQ